MTVVLSHYEERARSFPKVSFRALGIKRATTAVAHKQAGHLLASTSSSLSTQQVVGPDLESEAGAPGLSPSILSHTG